MEQILARNVARSNELRQERADALEDIDDDECSLAQAHGEVTWGGTTKLGRGDATES